MQPARSVQPRENRAHVPLRAAYHGHVLELAEQLDAAEKHACASGNHGLASAIQLSADWAKFMAEVVTPRLENSRREAWQAPMPSADGDCLLQDDFATGMDMPDAYPNVDDNFGSGYEARAPFNRLRSRLAPSVVVLGAVA